MAHFKECTRHLLLLLFFALDACDFASDWLVFHDFVNMENGLVFGPPDDSVVWSFLVFAVIGTAFFIVEIIILVHFDWKTMRHNQWEYTIWPDVISAVIVWCEDIPQVLISFYVALCRRDAISVFQLFKAGIVIVGSFVRFVIAFIRFCKQSKIITCKTKVIRTILGFGMVLNLGFSFTIVGLTYTATDSMGDVKFRLPTTGFRDTSDDLPYFDNVGLFIHHSELFQADNPDMNISDPRLAWLRLFSINNLKEDDGKLTFNITYSQPSPSIVKMAVCLHARRNVPSDYEWIISGCYTIDRTSTNVTVHENTTCADETFLGSSPGVLFLNFRFQNPATTLVNRKTPYGEIYYNAMQVENGKCSSLTETSMIVHYFQVSNDIDLKAAKHLVNETTDSARFFRNVASDMQDVRDAWKTGPTNCQATGSTSPVHDENMEGSCDSSV